MKITILGSGTSTGVPVLGCSCSVCKSSNPKNQRWRASILINTRSGLPIVIDTGPEFRLQLLRAGVTQLEHVLFTHLHADHCHGFDDLRGLYFTSKRPIHCWLHPYDLPELKTRFSYMFEETGYLGGQPDLRLHDLPGDYGHAMIGDIQVETFRAPHGNAFSSVFKFGGFVYATDFKTFPDEIINRWQGKIHTMVASGVRWKAHNTHSTIGETVDLFARLKVARGIITHINHEVDYEIDSKKLPPRIEFAYDGMTFDVPDDF